MGDPSSLICETHAFLRKSGISVVIAAIIPDYLINPVGGKPFGPADRSYLRDVRLAFSQFLSFSIPLIIIGLAPPSRTWVAVPASGWAQTAIAYGLTLFLGLPDLPGAPSCSRGVPSPTQLASVAEPGSADSYHDRDARAAAGYDGPRSLRGGPACQMVPRRPARASSSSSAIITRLIETIIIPLLPLHIFGIFRIWTYTARPPPSVPCRVAAVVLVLEASSWHGLSFCSPAWWLAATSSRCLR